jgi:hypothetical protein
MLPKYAGEAAALAQYYCDYATATTVGLSTILGSLARQLIERPG